LLQECFISRNVPFLVQSSKCIGNTFYYFFENYLFRVKLIFGGKVLKINTELRTHGVKNGTHIMAVILYSNPKELQVRSLKFYQ
jgi:hypothetical protein